MLRLVVEPGGEEIVGPLHTKVNLRRSTREGTARGRVGRRYSVIDTRTGSSERPPLPPSPAFRQNR